MFLRNRNATLRRNVRGTVILNVILNMRINGILKWNYDCHSQVEL